MSDSPIVVWSIIVSQPARAGSRRFRSEARLYGGETAATSVVAEWHERKTLDRGCDTYIPKLIAILGFFA
jgi:hypothetical protein